MKTKNAIPRLVLARKLGVSIDTLRYQERIGRFNPIRKTDEVGRPLIMYTSKEVEKAIKFYGDSKDKYSMLWTTGVK